jgi:hypothetical protein
MSGPVTSTAMVSRAAFTFVAFEYRLLNSLTDKYLYQ